MKKTAITKTSALDGVKVLDLTRLIAGPYATQMLADLGADVIKIEAPDGGDSSRNLTIPNLNGLGAMFIWANRNKKSICIDLKSESGKKIFLALIQDADIVVENFSKGVMDKLGLSYKTLSKINPRLIYCAISAFYRDSSAGSRAGFDTVIQAESGLMSLNGFQEASPVRIGPTVVDITTALNATNAILAAYIGRKKSRRGEFIETSLWAGAVTLIGNLGTSFLITGKNEERVGNSSKNASPAGLYKCKNGYVYITCTTEKSFELFCDKVLEDSNLSKSTEFKNYELRVVNSLKMDKIIQKKILKLTKEDLKQLASQYGLPMGVFNTVEEAYNSEEMDSQNMIKHVQGASGEKFPLILAPFRMQRSLREVHQAPPHLGEHTNEILENHLGMKADEIASLSRRGVIFQKS